MTVTQRPAMDTSDDSASGEGAPRTRAAWEVIEDARRARVTGELALTTASPAKTLIYLNFGSVYFAERETDESLATRLVLAGAINPDQLHRGALRLNGVEHLGRLFDRDTTVERDEVELALELMTEQALTEIAEQDVLSSHITMYRHHSSGVVRWFATPTDGTPALRADATGSPDSSPVPVVAPATVAPVMSPWEPPTSAAVPAPTMSSRESNIFDVDPALLNQPLPTLPAKPVSNRTPDTTPLARLQPLATLAAAKSFVPITAPVIAAVNEPVEEPVMVPVAEPVTRVEPTSGRVPTTLTSMSLTPMISSPVPVTALATGPVDVPISASPPLTSSPLALPAEIGLDTTPVPEDVAAAVRRAITAIEAATQTPNGMTSLSFGPLHVTSLGQTTLPAMDTGEQPIQPDTAPIEPLSPIVAAAGFGAVQPSPVGPTTSAGSEAKPPLTEERKSALRRLIDGVRRR